jgi:hypothetical protein
MEPEVSLPHLQKQPLDPILCHMNPFPALTSYFLCYYAIISYIRRLLSFRHLTVAIKPGMKQYSKAGAQVYNSVTEWSIARQRFGKHLLKTGIVEPERMSVAEQRLGSHLPAERIATNESLLGSKSRNTDFRDNKQNNRGTVLHGDLYYGRLEVIK